MPPPPPPTYDDVYAQLIAALHPSLPAVLEIEVLPSSFPPKILQESSAIGVPKSLLVPLYLKARKTFFDHISSHGSSFYHAALQSTAIILLFDPNHLTAANFRKRHIQRCSGERGDDGYSEQDCEGLAEAVRHELRFLESLVTSPLSKHAKSSTLWAQRLWIVQNFFREAVQEHASDEAVQMGNKEYGMRCFWDGELVVVMKAGEGHPRNYYAWQYARQLLSFVRFQRPKLVEGRHWDKEVLRDGIAPVRGWCLMHPRDISGWAFLVFLLEQLCNKDCDERDRGENENENEIGASALEIKEFARKFDWKGESIEWCLKAMKTLNIMD